MLKKLNKNKKARTLVTFLCVLISALSQAYVIQVFIQPANLLSSGFTGVAILIFGDLEAGFPVEEQETSFSPEMFVIDQ